MDDEVLDETVDALRHVLLRVQLSSSGWSDIEELLPRFTDAVAADDGQELSGAVASLDLLASRRMTSAETPPSEEVLGPASAPVRERINELIHTLESLRRGRGAGSDGAQRAPG
jgi:hypothetical protein